jgi:hypothetical protein
MAKLVTGLFKARSSAMLAIEDLMRHNISQEDISVSMTDSASGREFFPEVASKAPEYGVTGTIIGGIIGAVVAALIALGYIVDNGFTGLAGVNLFVATFCGLGVGMLVGLLIGMIAGSAVPEYELVFHPVGSARHSGYLVGVYTHPLREVEVRRLIRVRAMRDTPLRVYGQNQRDYATTAPAGTAPADREVPPTA